MAIAVERIADVSGLNPRELEIQRLEQASGLSILDLDEAVAIQTPEDRRTFNRIFEIGRSNGHQLRIVFPQNGMDPILAKNFQREGEDLEDTKTRMANQRIVTVINRYTKEGAIYNPERLRRPSDIKKPDTYRQDVANPKNICAFCDAENSTPTTAQIGRFSDEFGTTAANVTKFSEVHELLINKDHDPFEMTRDSFGSQVQKAIEISKAARQYLPEVNYFMLGENRGPDAGASLLHQHAQLVGASTTMHYAEAERWHEASVRYGQEHGRNFTEDWFRAHEMVGLGKRYETPEGEALVVVSLTPKKEFGVTVVGEEGGRFEVSSKFVDLCWGVEEFMIGKLGVEQFNTSLYFPPMGRDDGYWGDFRANFRFVKRSRSDMAIMEGAGTAVLSVDPKGYAQDLFHHLAEGQS